VTAGCSSRPRVGFLGVGWIGRDRMRAIAEDGAVEIAAIADPSADMVAEARTVAPAAATASTLTELLGLALDGLVIATPSALHADQSVAALEHGLAVFCQKPLGRSATEAERVVAAARKADRLLAVDLSYRFTDGMRRLKSLIEAGALGDVYAADLTFHNAYGPDKPWFYDPALSGGGCVMDLGVHLVDLALWALGFPSVTRVESTLFSGGKRLADRQRQVEDYAVATLELSTGAVVRIASSWRLHAGQEAQISCAFYGTKGGGVMENIDGSFYDFAACHLQGTSRHELSRESRDWSGRAAVDWARRLASGGSFDAGIENVLSVSRTLDAIFERAR
jgi:predicted dehydrogenase